MWRRYLTPSSVAFPTQATSPHEWIVRAVVFALTKDDLLTCFCRTTGLRVLCEERQAVRGKLSRMSTALMTSTMSIPCFEYSSHTCPRRPARLQQVISLLSISNQQRNRSRDLVRRVRDRSPRPRGLHRCPAQLLYLLHHLSWTTTSTYSMPTTIHSPHSLLLQALWAQAYCPIFPAWELNQRWRISRFPSPEPPSLHQSRVPR